ncbi:hypothetical protein CDEF62S_04659 [Castellaniella defragrans]
MKALKKLDVDKATAAIEADAKAGQFAQIHTPEQITKRRGRPVGSTQAVTKEAVKLRLDADVLAALRASGDGWQTRINDTLRASLTLGGKVKARPAG